MGGLKMFQNGTILLLGVLIRENKEEVHQSLDVWRLAVE